MRNRVRYYSKFVCYIKMMRKSSLNVKTSRSEVTS